MARAPEENIVQKYPHMVHYCTLPASATGGDQNDPMPQLGPEPFVGRGAELTRLTQAFARARAGQGSLTVVLGEAGSGKTRLIDQFASTVSPDGFAWGRAIENATVAYRPWRQAFRRLGLAFPLAEGGTALGPDERAGQLLQTAEEAVAMLAALPHDPAVLALDDLHWADDASLHLLRLLASEVAALPVMVLATSRDPEPGTPLEASLGQMLGRSAVAVLRLPPLSNSDVADYVATSPTLGARAADWVHRQSGGNALYVRELTRLLADEAVPTDISTWMPLELRILLARRLARLDEAVLAVMSSASVLGDEFDVGTLEALHGQPVAGALDTAVQRGVIILDPDIVGLARFSHGLVRSALYAGIPSAARVDLHRRAARLLEESGAAGSEEKLAELAVHALRGAATPEERSEAVAHLRRAAHVATRRLAYDEAARLLRSASATARLGPARPAERAEIELDLATAEFNAGFVRRAADSAGRAIGLAEEAGAPHLAAAAALVVSGVGIFDTSLGPLLSLKERALGLLPPGPAPLAVRLKAHIAHLRAQIVSVEAADADSRAVLDEAESLTDPDALIEAVRARHYVSSGPAGVTERRRLGARLIALGRDHGRPVAVMWGHLWRIDAAFQLGELQDAHREEAELARVVEALHRPLADWHLLVVRAGLALSGGRLDDTYRLAHEARRLAYRLEDHSAVGVTHAIAGEVERLRGTGDEHPERMAFLDHVNDPIAVCDVARVSFAVGETETARRLHERAKPLIPLMSVDGRWLPALCLFASTACDLGDPEGADAAYQALLPYAAHHVAGGAGSVGSQGSISGRLGRLAALLGRPDEAHGHFAEATEANRRAGVPPYLAEALLHWAQLAAQTDPASVRPLAEEAHSIASRLGMAVAARTSRSILDGLAGDAADDPLTRREREVATLVARGRSNREIAEHFVLSERTVETHVSRILTKLGLTSRTQLAAWVLSRR